MAALKNEIIGSWKLLSYIEVPVGGEEYSFPLGTNPKGVLIFNPDGYMSVQLSVQNPIKYNSDDRFADTDEKIAKRAKEYIAFAGKYTVNDMLAQVNYHIETSLYPNWEGVTQVRKLDFEGDILYQKSLEPISSNGQMVYAYMTWQKIAKVIDEEKIGRELEELY